MMPLTLLDRMCIAHHKVRVRQGYARKDWEELEDRIQDEYRHAMQAAMNVANTDGGVNFEG